VLSKTCQYHIKIDLRNQKDLLKYWILSCLKGSFRSKFLQIWIFLLSIVYRLAASRSINCATVLLGHRTKYVVCWTFMLFLKWFQQLRVHKFSFGRNNIHKLLLFFLLYTNQQLPVSGCPFHPLNQKDHFLCKRERME
jgi:hypothetical protein